MLTPKPYGEDGAPGRKSNPGLIRPPPGEDGIEHPIEIDEIENAAQDSATGNIPNDDLGDDEDDDFNEKPSDKEFLEMVREAEGQAQFYSSQINRRAWERAYKAYRQQHFDGSKYTTTDFKNRSRLFIPKTRSAVRKDLAATRASLFGSLDAINAMPGNEADPHQRASAAVVQELLNYRTDRSNNKASIPWFHVALGARQTSLMTGFCVSKQSWKLELKRKGTETFRDGGEERERDVWSPHIDRPDCQLIPPENCVIDPAADWTNPAQDSAYFIIKWPMRLDEIKRKQRDPRKPWNKVPDAVLKSAGEGALLQAAAIRRAREQGIDRYDETQAGNNFDVIWVWESFIRTAGEDWTFISIGDKHMLTDPAPVEEVYPEQAGERPLTFGYGSFEAFCVFPQAAVESWQMLQQEANDIRNLTLDAFKQNVMPVTKVVRGRQIDLDQLKRRGQGTAIMVGKADDVTWERPPDVPASAQAIKQQLDIDFDDLAGQQNYGTVENNNSLGKTLGGLKLAAGAANAVQEFDIGIWVETWAEDALNQIVKLEQYYESDETVLGLCGERAQLWEKHGISEITDELLENNVTIRVNIGFGSGDPQQRLAKFQMASQVALPMAQLDPRFKTGEMSVDAEAVFQEVFGGAGFRDGGKRFIKKGQPQANAQGDAMADESKASAELKRSQAGKAQSDAKAGIIKALVAAAGVGLDLKAMGFDQDKMQFDQSIQHMDQMGKAMDLGHSHGLALKAAEMAAKGLNVDGTPIDMPGTAPGPDYPDGKVPPEVLGSMPQGSEGGGDQPAGGGAPAASPTPQATGTPPMPPGDPTLAAAGPGAGNAGVNPAVLGGHGVPASDAGHQQSQDSAEVDGKLDKATKPRNRTVKITGRGADGRANQFQISE